MNILFSPIGTTDPISNFRDGAMLHICRHYDIDKVYLYISSEMLIHHSVDNRYCYCLDRLSELKGKTIEYEVIEKPDLNDNIYRFDYFLNEFKTIIDQIRTEYPEAKIFLNTSSGTTAMKSDLNALSIISEYPLCAIQVATPVKRSNPRSEKKDDYDTVEYWELNEDNEAGTENRCIESKNINYFYELKKKMIAELINHNDYVGAKLLSNELGEDKADFKQLLDGACKRIKYDFKNAKQIFGNFGYKIVEHENADKIFLSEYALLLNMKIKKEEYAEFLRAFTPFFSAMLRRVLKDRCGFDIALYIKTERKNGKTRETGKWLTSSLPIDIRTALNRRYGEMRENDYVKSDHLVTILNEKTDDNFLKQLIEKLRTAEIKIRNEAAHDMVSITEDYIKERIGDSPRKLFNNTMKLFNYTDIKIPDDFFLSYDRMNKILTNELDK